jgi:hypothetical protein
MACLVPTAARLVRGEPFVRRKGGGQKMTAKSKQAQVERAYIEHFGPLPSVRRQIITIAVAGAAMIFISAAMVQFGLI